MLLTGAGGGVACTHGEAIIQDILGVWFAVSCYGSERRFRGKTLQELPYLLQANEDFIDLLLL